MLSKNQINISQHTQIGCINQFGNTNQKQKFVHYNQQNISFYTRVAPGGLKSQNCIVFISAI